jgi:hypothetical protein
MVVEGGEKGLLEKVLNKQFEMIGEKVRFKDLPEDGMITVNGKKIRWYDHYKWDTMEQYEKWKKWARGQFDILGQSNADYLMMYADLRYGFTVRYKKEGELF